MFYWRLDSERSAVPVAVFRGGRTKAGNEAAQVVSASRLILVTGALGTISFTLAGQAAGRMFPAKSGGPFWRDVYCLTTTKGLRWTIQVPILVPPLFLRDFRGTVFFDRGKQLDFLIDSESIQAGAYTCAEVGASPVQSTPRLFCDGTSELIRELSEDARAALLGAVFWIRSRYWLFPGCLIG